MFEAVTFTPAEAEQITGVTGAVQRDWRRHGYLPSTKGHARFELHDLAELWLLKMFTDRGIGPQRAKVVSASLAHRIAYLTAQEPEAWEGSLASVPGEGWQEKLSLLNPYRPSTPPRRWFVWLADDRTIACDHLDRALGLSSGDAALHGPLIVFDLDALSSALMQRIGRPVLRIAADRNAN